MSRSLSGRSGASPSRGGPVAHEIIKGRLYYVALTRKPQDTAKSLYFTTDNTLVYWNFFLDFGPLNLGQTYRFCELLNRLLAAPEHKDKVIYYYSSTHSHRRTKRRFDPNIQKKTYYVPSLKRNVTLTLSAKGIKTIDARGIESVVSELLARGEKI